MRKSKSQSQKPQSVNSRKGQTVIDSWLKNHKTPVITALSISASAIVACLIFAIILTLSPVKKLSSSDPITDYGSSSDDENADPNRISANTRLNEVASSDAPAVAAAEAIPEYTKILENEGSSLADKVTSAIQLAKLYRIQGEIIPIIQLLNTTLDTEGLNSTQKLELLTNLEQAYSYGHDIDGQIETIYRILELPVDDDFTSEHKDLIARDYEYILNSLNTQKSQSDDVLFDDGFDYEFEEDAYFNSEEDSEP